MSSGRLKLLILALDGLDPDLFSRWRDNLPNLSRLAGEGIFSPIASTVPPMTFPAWSTVLTGVNPGKHGLFDFTEHLPGQLRVRFLNATRRRYPNFLRLASDQGMKVGSVGLPATYPPEPLSSFQISGFDTPLPSKADSSYMHPPDLAKKIDRELGGYYFGDFNEGRIGPGWHRRVLRKLLQGIDRKQKLVRFLLGEYPLDLLLLHVGETDTVGHHFWAFSDPRSPRFVPTEDSNISQAVLTVYRATDSMVGEILRLTDPDAVLAISDHGMGGTSDRMLYLNRFLAERGLLHFSKVDTYSRRIGTVKDLGLKWVPYRWQQWVFRLAGGWLAASIESEQRFGSIDWARTLAYSEELNYFPAIWLNLKSRAPFGVVSSDEADRVISRLREALLAWKDPQSGSAVVREVRRREDVYHGDEVVYAPDILIEFNQPEGYNYALGKSTSPLGHQSWRKLSSKEYIGRKGGSMNGSHRPLGTLILKANTVDVPQPERASLQDIAPTVLHFLNIGTPDWMEGRSLLPGARPKQPTVFQTPQEKPYSSAEEAAIWERLIQLGYLE